MTRFADRVALVTGAATGIGRATALAFAREAASVVVADVATDGNQETARLIERDGGHVLAVTCDVTRSDDIAAALHAAVGRFGRLDIAFNNAGIEQPIKPTHEITEQEWDRLVAVNLRGAFMAMKAEIELMLRHGGGAIVNTSSGAGIKGFAGQAAYAATKHGLIGLTKSAALDYAAQGIGINAICPGIIDTEMMRRFTGDTDEGRAAVIAQEPAGRMGRPRRSPPLSCGSAPTKPRSPSAMRWSSTAARPPDPSGSEPSCRSPARAPGPRRAPPTGSRRPPSANAPRTPVPRARPRPARRLVAPGVRRRRRGGQPGHQHVRCEHVGAIADPDVELRRTGSRRLGRHPDSDHVRRHGARRTAAL